MIRIQIKQIMKFKSDYGSYKGKDVRIGYKDPDKIKQDKSSKIRVIIGYRCYKDTDKIKQ